MDISWKRGVTALVAAVALLAPGAPPAAAAEKPNPDPIAHDPTLIRQGRYYYEIITGDSATVTYLPIRRSTDLIHWTLTGTVFDTAPAWVTAELGSTPRDFWAPDLSYAGGEYRLYYAASSFGTNDSVIGLATTKSLDRPDWVDRGMVLRTHAGDDVNAIDPEVTVDHDGVPWLSYGSFWDGVRMRRLDPRTGLLSGTDSTVHRLASRGGGAIEGPSITYHGGWYYLFVSFDFCCRGVNSDYRTMVGRSRDIIGPYTDRDGKPMLAGGGTQVLAGYNGFVGPGGGDVYGGLYVHHYYDAADSGNPKGSVRVIDWAGGWPRLSDPLSGDRGPGHGPAPVRLIQRDTGAALANATCGYEGADITLAPVDQDDPCQQWRLDDRGAGYLSLTNRQSNKVAEVAACVDADGARVAQWGWLANDCQRFRLAATADGWSRIVNPLAGRALRPAGCRAGAPVQTWAPGDCQDFRPEPVGDVLITGLPGRKWRFAHTTEGWYRILDTVTGRPLGATEWRIEQDRLVSRTGDTMWARLLTP
ncbi:family 43 glycosylhydrolase [Actinoplanes regularis]|uniref:Ricin-type beta-trefoil lectin domain-like n=1 Tax=Actinoplanes regularis TaxID=52697 RepID=A0A239HQJ0_9ACTN|nr:family 43 glycosylhydrolase [Actinoplanes regularis]SNS83550.1 Ricin-type beta-trefoil lectin domain-like [Actinoplanes regularis]